MVTGIRQREKFHIVDKNSLAPWGESERIVFSEGEDRNLLASKARLEISDGGQLWTLRVQPPPEIPVSLRSRNFDLPLGEVKKAT